VDVVLLSPEDGTIQFPKRFLIFRIPGDGQSPELQ
jgi:hypothetical protein